MATYHGYCPRCKNAGPIYLDTLINHPPVYCRNCGGVMECSSQAIAVPTNTPHATVTRIERPECEITRLSAGREASFQRLMVCAFGDHAGLVGYGLV